MALLALCRVLHTSSLVLLLGKQAFSSAISWKKQCWLSAEEQEVKSGSSCLSQSVGSSEISRNLKQYQQDKERLGKTSTVMYLILEEINYRYFYKQPIFIEKG